MTVKLMVTLLKSQGGGVYSPAPSQSYSIRRLGRKGPTNEWRAVAVGKDMGHEGLCIDASILITRARRSQDGLGNLEVDQRSGCWSLSLL